MKRSLLVAVCLSCGCAQAGTLLCGTRVISEGASGIELLAACGEPAQVDRSTVLRSAGAGTGGYAAATTVEVHLETWLYNFGPGKLMQRVRLEDGTVLQIDSLGYGY